jgi:hypothetical protein
MVLNASYVCLLHSHFIENQLIWILEHGPLISEVVLSHRVSGRSVPDSVTSDDSGSYRLRSLNLSAMKKGSKNPPQARKKLGR